MREMNKEVETHQLNCGHLFSRLAEYSVKRTPRDQASLQKVISKLNKEVFDITIKNNALIRELKKQPEDKGNAELVCILYHMQQSFGEMRNNIKSYRDNNTISLTNALNLEAPGRRSIFSRNTFINEPEEYETAPLVA